MKELNVQLITDFNKQYYSLKTLKLGEVQFSAIMSENLKSAVLLVYIALFTSQQTTICHGHMSLLITCGSESYLTFFPKIMIILLLIDCSRETRPGPVKI
jgi:hypothetical protein